MSSFAVFIAVISVSCQSIKNVQRAINSDNSRLLSGADAFKEKFSSFNEACFGSLFSVVRFTMFINFPLPLCLKCFNSEEEWKICFVIFR